MCAGKETGAVRGLRGVYVHFSREIVAGGWSCGWELCCGCERCAEKVWNWICGAEAIIAEAGQRLTN